MAIGVQQNNLLAKLFAKAKVEERKLIPYVIVPKGSDTQKAVEDAIRNGFPVDRGEHPGRAFFATACPQAV